MATAVVVDFKFEFAQGDEGLKVEIPLSGPPAEPEGQFVQRLILECPDLSDEDELEELEWELESALQYDLIMPRLRLSDFQVDTADDKLLFQVSLTLWGKEFSRQDFLHDFSDSGLTESASPEKFKEFVLDTYYGSHHYFDVTSLELTVLP